MTKSGRHASDPEVERRIRELIAFKGGGANEESVRDVIDNALKLLKDVRDSGDARIIQTALREMRYAFRLFAPYAGKRKVTMFGSARTPSSAPEYQQAVEFGRKIVEAGFMVITGAGGGIMQAGHEGAGMENSFGANIRLPWEQNANPVIQDDKKLVTFKYFFTRKLMFVRHSDAFALFPGGFGTLDEGFEALTLMQTGKSQLIPLVLIDRPGGMYWKNWDHYVKESLLGNALISPEDLGLYHIATDVDDAVNVITHFYRNYHSSRFVKDLFVIRLQRVPSGAALEALNRDFADIISGEKLKPIKATADERADGDFVDLQRIAFGFNRRDYGRLRQLIDALNDL